MFKKLFKKYLKSRQLEIIKVDPSKDFINTSYSQEGEDLLLARLLKNKSNGFFVDIGAHHPFRFSNTYKFYQCGWRGINIEPLPGSMKLFNEHRPLDINLEIAILNEDSKEMLYYTFDEQAHNTFDESSATNINNTVAKIKKTIPIKAFKLSTVLEKNLPTNQQIDFFTIDVEGMDLNVLMSNDWIKFRPEYVLAEDRVKELKDNLNSELTLFMESKNYKLAARLSNSVIFKNSNK